MATSTDPEEDDRRPRYVVLESDVAVSDRDAVFPSLVPILGPDLAGDWYAGLVTAIKDLPEFPGPRSHATDTEATAYFGFEVRRALYQGPRRRGKLAYRILFTLLPPAEEGGETIIRVLRILHGAQSLSGAQEAK